MCHRRVAWACPFSAPESGRWLCHSALGWLFRWMPAALSSHTLENSNATGRTKGKRKGLDQPVGESFVGVSSDFTACVSTSESCLRVSGCILQLYARRLRRSSALRGFVCFPLVSAANSNDGLGRSCTQLYGIHDLSSHNPQRQPVQTQRCLPQAEKFSSSCCNASAASSVVGRKREGVR